MSEKTKFIINEIATACLLIGGIVFFMMLSAPQ